MKEEIVVELWAASIPGFSGLVADHHWLLVLRGLDGDHHESCDRWEIWQRPSLNDSCWGHLHKNLLAPYQDVGNGPSRLIRHWVAEDAKLLSARIESAPRTYPFKSKYVYWPGPNSNTFVQWVVRDRMSLSARALGKRYPVPENAG